MGGQGGELEECVGVQGGRVRGEFVGGGCETVSPSTVHCAGIRDRVESQR